MKITNKKGLFKVIGASALATFMLATSLFAFIPHLTQAEALNSNQTPSSTQTTTPTTEQTGLITPRADDPVLFTTESGLEIKYGNATLQGNLSSGNLSGFPYFRTSKDGMNFDWVIIGSRYNTFLQAGTDVAQTAILKDLANVLQIQIPVEEKTIVHEEIPEGCYLVWANTPYGSCASSGWSSTSKHFLALQTFYEDDVFGFGNHIDYIKKTLVTTQSENSSLASLNCYFFSLDYDYGSNASQGNFLLSSYVSSTQQACSPSYYVRMIINYYSWMVNSTGAYVADTNRTGAALRPAFIFQWHAIN